MVRTLHRLKKVLVVSFIACALGLFAGCSKAEYQIAIEKNNVDTIKKTDLLNIEWKKSSSAPKEVEGWDVVEYIPNVASLSSDERTLWMNMMSFGVNDIYSLLLYEKDDEYGYTSGYELKNLDLVDLSEKLVFGTLYDLDFGSMWNDEYLSVLEEKLHCGLAQIYSLDVFDDKAMILLSECDEEGWLEHLYKVCISEDGVVDKVQDYIELFQEKNIFDGSIIPEMICCNDGVTLFVDMDLKKIHYVDSKAKIITSVDISDIYTNLRCVGKSPEGIPVFLYSSVTGKTEFFYIDESGKNILFEEDMEVGICSIDGNGNILLLNGSKLYLWDVYKGDINYLYSFVGLDTYSCVGICGNANGEIIVCFEEGEDAFLYRLNDKEHQETKTLVLLQEFYDSYTAFCAADYSRTHPGVNIVVEQLETNDEYNKNILLNQIKEGNGPDLIWTDKETINSLKNAGAISSLNDLISSDMEKNIFSGVLDFGKIGTELYALPCEALLKVLMIKKGSSDLDDWNVQEAINEFGTWNKRSGGKKFFSTSYSLDPLKLFNMLCGMQIEQSIYVDLETMKCDFQRQEFYDLLDFCLEYSETELNSNHYNTYSTDEIISQVDNGEAFLLILEGNLIHYSTVRKKLGEEYKTIGYPTKDKVSCLVECYHGVALNTLSDNQEIAKDFLEMLVSKEYQIKYSYNWIRKDVLQEQVKDASENHDHGDYGDYDDPYKDSPFFEINSHASIPLEGREDGTSYVDEYIQLMDEGISNQVEYAIQNILFEEIQAFFLNEKTAQEVAAIIQNRVSLFLQERE